MISAVIPVFNEAESLASLVGELHQVAESQRLDLEIIFVDDGSTDQSWSIIESLSQTHANKKGRGVRGIRFRRNFGKAAALAAGFKEAVGEVVFTLDADLQDNPKEIPRFLAKLNEGYDVVSGWKRVRHDPFHKTIPSFFFNRLVGWLTGVKLHDHNCGFKCYRREVLDEVTLYGEMHRFIPVLAAARGFKVSEIDVDHRARQFGKSKYGFSRIFKGFLDLMTVYFLTGFRQRPQHLLGGAGLIAFSVSSIILIYLTIYWVIRMTLNTDLLPLSDRPLLIYAVGGVLLGVQLISMGFLAELITAYLGRQTPNFSVKQTTVGQATVSEMARLEREGNVGSGVAADTDAKNKSTVESHLKKPDHESWRSVGITDQGLEDPTGLRKREQA